MHIKFCKYERMCSLMHQLWCFSEVYWVVCSCSISKKKRERCYFEWLFTDLDVIAIIAVMIASVTNNQSIIISHIRLLIWEFWGSVWRWSNYTPAMIYHSTATNVQDFLDCYIGGKTVKLSKQLAILIKYSKIDSFFGSKLNSTNLLVWLVRVNFLKTKP